MAIDLVVDTSALPAILLGEPEAAGLLAAPAAEARIGLCAPNRTELLLVIQSRLGDVGVERAKRLLAMLFKGNDFSQTDVRVAANPTP